MRRAAKWGGGVLALLAAICGGIRFWYFHRPAPLPTSRALFRGMVYTREVWHTPRPVVLHWVRIDLQTPGLRWQTTPGIAARRLPFDARTTSAYLRETGAQVAINGDFFYPWKSNALWDYYPHVGDPVTVEGRACSNGVCLDAASKQRFPSLFLGRDNRAFIDTSPRGKPLFNVVSGNEIVLRDGKILAPISQDVQPRTAVGLDAPRRHLLLLVVDGRQPNYSEGITTRELASTMRLHGATTALNLDGGGSATLAVQGLDGSPQVLSCPIDNHIPGRERPVANHLAVFASPF